MQRKSLILSALPLCLLPLAALAQGPSVNIGVDLTTNYVDEGVTVSGNKAAIQPHIELTQGIFYGGLWFSNIDTGADTVESDVYFGITGDLPGSTGLSYDFLYTRTYYNSTGDQGGSLDSSITYALSDALSFGVTYTHDLPGTGDSGEFAVDYSLPHGFGVSGEIGRAFAGGEPTYGSIAISKDITDSASIEVAYNDTTTTTPIYTLTLSWSMGMFEK